MSAAYTDIGPLQSGDARTAILAILGSDLVFCVTYEPRLDRSQVAAEVGPGPAERQVEVIQHEVARGMFPSATNTYMFQSLEQYLPTAIVLKDSLPRIASRHPVICAG
jgi:hypothetical protein